MKLFKIHNFTFKLSYNSKKEESELYLLSDQRPNLPKLLLGKINKTPYKINTDDKEFRSMVWVLFSNKVESMKYRL